MTAALHSLDEDEQDYSFVRMHDDTVAPALDFERFRPRPQSDQLLEFPKSIWFDFKDNRHPLAVADFSSPHFPLDEGSFECLRWLRMVYLGELNYGDHPPPVIRCLLECLHSENGHWTNRQLRCLVKAFHPNRWTGVGGSPHRWTPMIRYFYQRCHTFLSVDDVGEDMLPEHNYFGQALHHAVDSFWDGCAEPARRNWLHECSLWVEDHKTAAGSINNIMRHRSDLNAVSFRTSISTRYNRPSSGGLQHPNKRRRDRTKRCPPIQEVFHHDEEKEQRRPDLDVLEYWIHFLTCSWPGRYKYQ